MFFSTQYCASVKDSQCVPHDEEVTESCSNIKRKLDALERKMSKQKQNCDGRSTSVTDEDSSNDALTTALIVICTIFFIVAVVLSGLSLKIWNRSRRRKLKANFHESKETEFEMNHQLKDGCLVRTNPATIS